MMVRELGKYAAAVGLAAIAAAGISGGSSRGQTPADRGQTPADLRDDASPFGIGSSAEWSREYPRFIPTSAEAGIRWFRVWPEWQGTQPAAGKWNWDASDGMLASARAANGHIIGIFHYLAPWASATGKGSRAFPMKDISAWRQYVRQSLQRYHGQIKYWEIWNEYNSPAFNNKGNAKDYAEMVIAAFEEARKIDPQIKIAITCANFDVQFLDEVIKAGAADHFDFVTVHPYEAFGAVMYGGETAFLGETQTLRDMLAANKQPTDMPLWITECGTEAPVKPEAAHDQRQAEAIVKLFALATAQGFSRTFWFEARGPAYGSGTDYGIIREDWSLRPSWYACRTMTALLGQAPRFLGWTRLASNAYGFVFQGAAEPVLVAWSPVGTQQQLNFTSPVRVTSLAGEVSPRVQTLALTQSPVFITGVPAELLKEAQATAGKPFTFDGDYSQAAIATCRLGERNESKGLRQVSFRKDTENRTAPATVAGESCQKAISADRDRHCAYFRVDPTFMPYGTRNLAVTVVARRSTPQTPAEVGLKYESTTRVNDYFLRYRPAAEKWIIPADEQWHEYTWKLQDASFLGQWGWNLALIMSGETKEFLIKEVRVEKLK